MADNLLIIERLLDQKQMNDKLGMYAKVTVKQGGRVSYHEHTGDAESYFILSGEGVYNDNGTTVPAKPGDHFWCKDGDGHAIENNNAEDLVFMALIVKS